MPPLYIYILLAFCIGLSATIPAYLFGRAYKDREVVFRLKSIDVRLGRLERALYDTAYGDPKHTIFPIGYIDDEDKIVSKVLKIVVEGDPKS